MCDGVESRIIGKGGQNIRALMHRTGRTFASSPKCTSASSPARRTPWRPRPRRCATSSRISAPRDPRAARVRPAAADTAAAEVTAAATAAATRAPQQQGYGGGGYGGGYAPPQQGYGGGGGYAQSTHPHGHGSYGGYAQPGPDPYAGVGYGGGDPAAAGRGPAPTGATGLPDGWQELSSDGQVYYWNTHTNQTQYERPQ